MLRRVPPLEHGGLKVNAGTCTRAVCSVSCIFGGASRRISGMAGSRPGWGGVPGGVGGVDGMAMRCHDLLAGVDTVHMGDSVTRGD